MDSLRSAFRYFSTSAPAQTTAMAASTTKYINKRVPGLDTFYPLNEPQVGETFPPDTFPQNAELPALFRPLTLRGVTFPNRVWVAPMCMYSSDNGHATDWHLVHIGGFAKGGAGAICLEATAVVPEGRISPEDAGLWTDSQIAPLKRIVDFVHTQGGKVGVQLAHAGRKASTYAPWVHSDPARKRVAPGYVAGADENGWPDNVYGPSGKPFNDKYPHPKEMSEKDMQYVEDAFVAAAARCKTIGFDFIEVHAAHGYIFHSWLSPISNTRTDAHGGAALEHRMAYPLRVVKAMRAAWGERPLFVRISATDFHEGPEKDEQGAWRQWGVEQSIVFCGELKKLGVDFVDVSAGGNDPEQKITVKPGYQVPYAEEIKKAHPDLAIGAVGLITEPKQAEEIVKTGQADVVRLAREFLRDPNFTIRAAAELGASVKPPNQYERAWAKMMTPAKREESVRERAKEQGSA